MGVVYTLSHAIDYEDNGAGSGSGGLTFNYPSMYRYNRGSAGFDEHHNLQVWGVYSLPFGPGQMWLNHGLAGDLIGGWQLSGQFSHFSGFPFSVTANSNTIGGFAPGFNATYAQLTGSYKQIRGHAQKANNPITGGKPWFDPTIFTSPAESGASLAIANTGRNEFRGPGNTQTNASLVKNFHIVRESEFQFRFEAFNVFNHPWLNAPNSSVGPANFDTTYASTHSMSPRLAQTRAHARCSSAHVSSSNCFLNQPARQLLRGLPLCFSGQSICIFFCEGQMRISSGVDLIYFRGSTMMDGSRRQWQ